MYIRILWECEEEWKEKEEEENVDAFTCDLRWILTFSFPLLYNQTFYSRLAINIKRFFLSLGPRKPPPPADSFRCYIRYPRSNVLKLKYPVYTIRKRQKLYCCYTPSWNSTCSCSRTCFAGSKLARNTGRTQASRICQRQFNIIHHYF